MLRKLSLLALGLIAGTASAQWDPVTGWSAPTGWPSGWSVDSNGYIHDGSTGPMWPVQFSDLPDDPENSSNPTSVTVDTPLVNHKWFYRWQWSPVQYRTHTPFRRLNYEEVLVLEDASTNYSGPIEGALGDLSVAYDNSDLTAFTTAFNNQDPSADRNGDGIWDQADLTDFITDFNALNGSANNGIRTERRIGWVQEGMWVGIDSTEETDIPASQPYYEGVDSFELVPNMWQTWRVSTTEIDGTLTSHSNEVVVYDSTDDVTDFSSVSVYNSSVRLLTPPAPITESVNVGDIDGDSVDDVITVTRGAWELLWYDKDALDTRGIQVPIALQPIAVGLGQAKDSQNVTIDYDIDNVGGTPEVIWVNVRHERTATSWETCRYVPAGTALAWEVQQPSNPNRESIYTQAYSITDFSEAPSQLWTPQMFGVLEFSENDEERELEFYNRRWGIPNDLRPSTSTISSYYTNGDPDYTKFDGSAARPWTIEPERVGTSTTTIKLLHANLVSGHSPQHTYNIPRYVDVALNPLDHAELETSVSGYDSGYTESSVDEWEYRAALLHAETVSASNLFTIANQMDYTTGHKINPDLVGPDGYLDFLRMVESYDVSQVEDSNYSEQEKFWVFYHMKAGMLHYSHRPIGYYPIARIPSDNILDNGPEIVRNWNVLDRRLNGFYASTIALETEARNGEISSSNSHNMGPTAIANYAGPDVSSGFVPKFAERDRAYSEVDGNIITTTSYLNNGFMTDSDNAEMYLGDTKYVIEYNTSTDTVTYDRTPASGVNDFDVQNPTYPFVYHRDWRGNAFSFAPSSTNQQKYDSYLSLIQEPAPITTSPPTEWIDVNAAVEWVIDEEPRLYVGAQKEGTFVNPTSTNYWDILNPILVNDNTKPNSVLNFLPTSAVTGADVTSWNLSTDITYELIPVQNYPDDPDVVDILLKQMENFDYEQFEMQDAQIAAQFGNSGKGWVRPTDPLTVAGNKAANSRVGRYFGEIVDILDFLASGGGEIIDILDGPEPEPYKLINPLSIPNDGPIPDLDTFLRNIKVNNGEENTQ